MNADEIAHARWPAAEAAHAYDASNIAAEQRAELLADRQSFVTETVFSHESKLSLSETAVDAGYLVTLHVVAIPVDLAVARVADRVRVGGHAVPETKIRVRYDRLWPLVRSAIAVVDRLSCTTIRPPVRRSGPSHVSIAVD